MSFIKLAQDSTQLDAMLSKAKKVASPCAFNIVKAFVQATEPPNLNTLLKTAKDDFNTPPKLQDGATFSSKRQTYGDVNYTDNRKNRQLIRDSAGLPYEYEGTSYNLDTETPRSVPGEMGDASKRFFKAPYAIAQNINKASKFLNDPNALKTSVKKYINTSEGKKLVDTILSTSTVQNSVKNMGKDMSKNYVSNIYKKNKGFIWGVGGLTLLLPLLALMFSLRR